MNRTIPSTTAYDSKKQLSSGPGILIFSLALIKLVAPYIIQSSVYEPHRDEFLYLAEARHLDWGYLEVPPMTSFFAYLINFMGGSLFWIKFWPSLFGALTYVLVARLILAFGGRRFALVLGFLPFVLGYYMHLHFMLQPNFLEVFFWTLMAYGLIRHVQTNSPKGLYIAGIALGFGLLSKYSVSFFAIGLLMGMLLTKERKILLNKHFYIAILIGLVIFLPNLLWQWSHGFPLIEQAQELKAQQLDSMSQAAFLLDQLLYNLPCIFTWLAGLYWLGFTREGKPYRFIGWAVFVAMVILVAGHGKGYYGMGAYPVLFGFGAVFIERLTANKSYYMRYALVIFALISGCFLDTVTLPFLPPAQLSAFYAKNNIFIKTGFLKWEDQKDHLLPQDFADMLSWQDMTQKVAKVYNGLTPSEKSQSIIDCDNYGEAAAIDYYGQPFHLTSPMGHGASYLFWTPMDFNQKNIFILTTDYRAEMHESFVKEFRYAAIVDSITNPCAREYGSYIVLFKYPSDKFRKEWKDYYESLKKSKSTFH